MLFLKAPHVVPSRRLCYYFAGLLVWTTYPDSYRRDDPHKGRLMSQLPWVYLLFAGLFEVGFATFLKMSDGFTRAFPTAGFIFCICLSFWLFNKAIATIPLGTAYAIFTGIGVLGTVLVQIYFFDAGLSVSKAFFVLLLISAVIGLKMTH